MGLEETQSGATAPTPAHELARDPAAFEPPPAPVAESPASSPAPVETPASDKAGPVAVPGAQPEPTPAVPARRPGRPPRAARAGEDPAKLELKRLKDRIRKAKTPEAAAAAARDFQAAQEASEADGPEAKAEESAIASADAGPAAPAPETTAPAGPPPEPKKIMGADAETVALLGPYTLQAWGKLADKAEGTRYEFRGDREMVFFPGTPFEQTVKAHPERDLAQLTAVVIAKHLPKAINAAAQPEVMLAGAVLMTFGLPAVGHAVEAVREWWRDRAARAEGAAGGEG